jgi:hypothetical protein
MKPPVYHRMFFIKAGVDSKVDIRCGDSKKMLPSVVNEIGNIRFAFLDASHLYEDVLFEFYSILPALTEDVLVLFDNTYQTAEPCEDPGVHGALRTIKQQHGGELINLEFVS